MSVDFFEPSCQTYSNQKIFGLCDDPPPNVRPAYIDEKDGSKWIAVVVNDYLYPVTFTAIDRCVKLTTEDGNQAKRCDGVLFYDSIIIFVELKERRSKGNQWVKDAEAQIRTTIQYFEASLNASDFDKKKAYIANSEHPKFKSSQARRMDQFLEDTGYVLRIENRIILE